MQQTQNTPDETKASMPLFVEELLAQGDRVEHMSNNEMRLDPETRTWVSSHREWTRTTRAIPTPYRGWWIIENTEPESPNASQRHSFDAYYHGLHTGYAGPRESHLYATDVPGELTLAVMQAQLDTWMQKHLPKPQPTPVPASAEPVLVDCPNCGMSVRQGQLMSANFGVACPSCYDDAAES